MTEKTSKFFLEYIDTLLLEDKEKNVLLMRHDNAFCVTAKDIEKMNIEKKGYQVICHSFEYTEMRRPYEPFLDIISNFIRKKQEMDSSFFVGDFLEQAEVYPMHKQIFETYFQNGSCERCEEMIIGEYQYERRKFRNAVLCMLKKIAEEQPVFMVVKYMKYMETLDY